MEAAAPSGSDQSLSPVARKAIWGAFVGFFVDMYDVYLPVVALTPALIYFQPKNLPAATVATIFYVVFAVTLVGRPIGSFIFGHLGDRIGRRKTTLIAVTGFGVVTLLIAFLPGFEQIGVAALVLLITLRLVDGIFLGGEYTAASPLAMEYSPKARRGLYSAIIQAGYPVAYIAISLFTALMLFLTPSKGLHSAYVQWGWRVPFVVGALIALGFVLWYRTVPESKSWQEAPKTENPVGTLFSDRSSRRVLFQVFILMTGFWLSLNTTISTLPIVLTKAKLPTTTVTYGLLVANLVLVGAYILAGLAGQRFGRRPVLMTLGILIVGLSTSAYLLLLQVAPRHDSLVLTMALATVVTSVTVCGWGLMSAYITERFATGIRASGFGIGYSLAVVIPAFYSFAMLGLARFMPYRYTQIPLLALGGLLILVGAALGPETREVDLTEPALGRESEEPARRVSLG